MSLQLIWESCCFALAWSCDDQNILFLRRAGHRGWLTRTELLLKLGVRLVQLIHKKSSGKATQLKVAQIAVMSLTTVMYVAFWWNFSCLISAQLLNWHAISHIMYVQNYAYSWLSTLLPFNGVAFWPIFITCQAPHAWPGLPRGVKFDPTDQEIIWHLLAKAGIQDFNPHPFIDEFVPTVEEEDGICYAHPQNLPGIRRNLLLLLFSISPGRHKSWHCKLYLSQQKRRCKAGRKRVTLFPQSNQSI